MRLIKFSLLCILIVFSLLVFSCQENKENKPQFYNEKFNKDNISGLVEKLKSSKQVTLEDIDFLNNALNRYTSKTDSLLGKSIQDLIKEEKDRFMLASANNVFVSATRTQIHLNLGLEVNDFEVKQEGSIRYNTPTYVFTNKSQKDIISIRGHLDAMVDNKTVVKRMNIEMNQVVKAGEKLTFKYKYELNPENERDTYLSEHFDELAKVWYPISIKFGDGTAVDINKE